MSRRTINLVLVAISVAVVVWVGSGLIAGTSSLSSPAEEPSTISVSRSPEPSPTLETSGMRGYALSLPEVEGLPPNLDPGSRLELWVAWDPPLTKEPRIQKLVRGVVYERTIPAVVQGEPPTAMVLVPEDEVDELMYGDRYGSLSASLNVGP